MNPQEAIKTLEEGGIFIPDLEALTAIHKKFLGAANRRLEIAKAMQEGKNMETRFYFSLLREADALLTLIGR